MIFETTNCLIIKKEHVLNGYQENIIHKLKIIEKVCDQAEGAMNLLFKKINYDNWSQRNDVNNKEKMNLCLLRCALSEIVGIEDALGKYFSCDKIFHLSDTDDPIIHFIKELRNFEIHIKETSIGQNKINITDNGEKVTDNNIDVCIIIDILNIDLASFKKLRNFPKYTPQQWAFMKEKFDELQMDWGYQEVIVSAVEKYCSLIIDHYGL
jgi:hypothetical protein